MDDPVDMMREAEAAARRLHGQARWYPLFVGAFGVISALIVAAVPVFRNSWAIPLAVVIIFTVTTITVWRYRQPVRPVNDRRVFIWMGCWLVLFLLAIWVVGPSVAGRSVLLWAVLGALQAMPAFIEAAIWAGRTRV